jgi:hypothetical protein
MVKKQDEKPIERKPVTSSNIVSAGFCPDRKCIDVEFTSGVYRYHDCDQALFDDLLKSESVGRFVHANLKSKKFTKI